MSLFKCCHALLDLVLLAISPSRALLVALAASKSPFCVTDPAELPVKLASLGLSGSAYAPPSITPININR